MGMHLEEEYAKCSHCQFVDESTLDLNLCKEQEEADGSI